MGTMLARVLRGRTGIFIAAAILLGAGLTACGTASDAAATATSTPNCTRVRTTQAISGTITAVSAGGIQVTNASGAVTAVQFTTTTRITRIVTTTAASLTAGTSVQVTPDTTGSTALRIVITSQGTGGPGGFGDGTGGARGTPPAGLNPACLGTRTPGTGPFQGGRGQGAVTRGTVTSASSVHVVLTDSSGETLAFAITPATVILTSAAGTPSDLTSGSKVTVTGTRSGSTLVARSIVLQPPTAAQ